MNKLEVGRSFIYEMRMNEIAAPLSISTQLWTVVSMACMGAHVYIQVVFNFSAVEYKR